MMKQVVQSYKTGEVKLCEVPVPLCSSKRVLVRNRCSLISIGTERGNIELGRKSLVGKAAARPDLVRRVWDKAKKEGLLKTWNEAMGRLDAPTPLGYSCAGVIEECGDEVTEVSPGDRVACVGQGFASHGQMVSVPANLMCRIPREVSEEQASFGMLGIIAMHGIRSAGLSFGSRVVVMGLGLIGLLTVQMLRAYGCEVMAIDPDLEKVNLAKKLSFNNVVSQQVDLQALVQAETCAQGADAILVTAATKKKDPVDQAIQLSRSKGRIVIVGVVDIHPDRNELWQKEVELVVSKAAGPGSLDPLYEIEGVDLPIGEVRWTQKRNLEEFLRLIKNETVNVNPLISHRFSINEAVDVYKKLMDGNLKTPIGVLLDYPETTSIQRRLSLSGKINSSSKSVGAISTGVIGAGLFGKALLLPVLQKETEVSLHTLVTLSGANAEHNGRKFGFVEQATDEEVVWNSDTIEAIVGLTPHHHHSSLVKSAIRSGKALFLEKPLCINQKELKEIEMLAVEVDQLPLIMVGHNRAFSPHIRQLKRWLMHRKNPLVVKMRVNVGFVSADHWVNYDEEGRSRVVGEMSHFIDLIKTLTESQVSRVHAERIGGDNLSAVNNDNVVVTMKFDDGSVASLTYVASGDKAYSREMLEVFFEGKTFISKDFRITKKFFGGKVQTFKTHTQEMGYKEELKHFALCLKGKQNLVVGLEKEVSTMRTIFAIEKSLATGKAVNLS